MGRSGPFYSIAGGLEEAQRKTAPYGAFRLVELTDGQSGFSLERTWMRDREDAYELGEGEFHLCMRVAGDYEETRRYHQAMGCVCYENTEMGLYFIEDPDGYWIEILQGE